MYGITESVESTVYLSYIANFTDDDNPKRRTFCVWKYKELATFKMQMIEYV
jgi:hypothetical protein